MKNKLHIKNKSLPFVLFNKTLLKEQNLNKLVNNYLSLLFSILITHMHSL